MFTDFCGLDCAWRGLWVNIFIASLILVIMYVSASTLTRKMSWRQMKWYLNAQYLGLSAVLVGNFLWIAFADPELASRCFAQFAKLTESFTLTRLLAGAWLMGVLGLLTLDIFKTILVLIRSRGRSSSPSPQLQGLIQSIARQMNVKVSPDIVLDHGSAVPHVIGLFRYRIVMPSTYKSEGDDTAENILAHEMAHVRDRDSLWMLVELFCRRVLFFHPLIYILQRRYHLTIEKAADETAVIANGLNPLSLVRTLCQVAQNFSTAKPAAIQVNATRGFSELKARMEALIEMRGRRLWSARVFASVAALTLFVIVALSVTHVEAVARESAGLAQVNMCSQLNQEKMIESWLRIEREAVQCDK